MYSTEHLANEILDSYSILFDCERKSRTIYSAMREKSAFSNGIGDPLLDELCGYHRPRWSISDLAPPRAAMDASLCFPILSTRLLKLQTYMDGQGARGLRALHRDRRDSYQWWTFWAVIWLGGLNLVFAFTQTITGIIQVVYAMKAARCSAL